jgi:type III pantothenate kinase
VSPGSTIAQAYHRLMIICVDVGNSGAKIALVDGNAVLERARAATSDVSQDALSEGLRTLVGDVGERPTAIIAVSVVERWLERLERSADELGLPLTIVASSNVPIPTALVRPDLTGADRLLAAWAATSIYGAPAVVIDLGTATTVNAVDADGFFLGGAILPGLALAADSLAEGTARLPRVELDLPADAIGSDTTAAIQIGLIIGQIGAIREIVTRMREHIGADAKVIFTGGHTAAPWAQKAFLESASEDLPAVADIIDPDLVMKGLNLLARQMADSARDAAAP